MNITTEVIRGRAALESAVERFNQRVAADPELAGSFEGIDMRRILARQLTLFALLAAGSAHLRAGKSARRTIDMR